ncbi:MAG: efflux transporter outer membrane subunit [Rhodanobacter sp.]|nr:MAG: efflux transporter outer membrane subunit [Rhodanobacter sp.]TAM12051.1 MAG: efflux transporter outer membrane subunit [Rhodanobacter sp.]TAM34608.1 MAG: efflux transporter outer membrane subunit [Rhodanobacter sp.]
MLRKRAARVALATLPCALLLSACAVGPAYHQPASPKATLAVPASADGAQRFVPGAEVSGDWWTLFHSPQLDALIAQALAHNPDLKAAQAALRVANENALAQRGAFLPSVSVSLAASRQRQAGTLAPVPNSNTFEYNLFTPQLSVSYAPDVFGATRRGAESLAAQTQAARFQMIAVWNTLASNVAVTAIQLASLNAQIDATQHVIDAGTQMLDITQLRLRKGYASGADVAAQETQLAQLKAGLPPLRKQQAQTRDALAMLTGHFPSPSSAPSVTLNALQLPENLPVSLPSALVAQRPDVRQAEANLHAASAQVGIATAARLPSLTLSADTGSTALAFSKLFTAGTGFWDFGTSLVAPVFQGGTLLHQQRAAKAAYAEAAAQYRSTVLGAFQNVADALAALDADAGAVMATTRAEQAAERSRNLAQRQQRDGYADNLALLNAEQAWQQTRIASIQARANRLADTAALYQALGGGWWHHPDLAKP